MKNNKTLYIVSFIGLLIGFAIAMVVYQNYEKDKLSFLAQENAELFVRDYSPVYGDKNAKIYLVEFLDPECESCRAFYPQVKALLKEYPGKVQLVVRYAPFHKNSKIAIKALEAARMQGKYWEALELLFQFQPQWGDHHHPNPGLIFEYLPTLGLEMNKLKNDMLNPIIEKNLAQDISDLRALNVRGTPTFFVNGKPLKQFGVFGIKQLIEEELKLLKD